MATYGVIGQRQVNGGERGQYTAEFDNYGYVKMVLDAVVDDLDKLVSGGGHGAEALAEKWASETKTPFSIIKPAIRQFLENTNSNNPSVNSRALAINNAFLVRNNEIIQVIDRLFVFWDGSEPILLATIVGAVKAGKRVTVFPIP